MSLKMKPQNFFSQGFIVEDMSFTGFGPGGVGELK